MRRSALSIIGAVCAALLLPGAAAASDSRPAAPAGGPVAAPADSPNGQRLKQSLRQARKWARKPAVKQRRECRSGNNYSLRGRDYSGAYGLSQRAWRRNGGWDFAPRPDRASRAEQDYVARKYVRRAGLDAVGCDTDDWMGRVYAQAPQTPLSQMLIPGTHDSGTVGIRTEDPCSTTFVDGATGLAGLSAQNPCVFAQLYRSQDLTLRQQLQRGVRYLDLRVGIPSDHVVAAPPAGGVSDPADVPLVISHQLVSVPLAEALAGVQKFIARHPREQIVLDFQEFNLPADPAVAAYYQTAMDQLLREYAPGRGTQPICDTAWSRDKIRVPDDVIATDVPVRRAWRKKVSAIVYFKSEEKPTDGSCYRDRWAGGGFLYPNTDDPATSVSDNRGYLVERKRRIASGNCTDAQGNDYCGINVSQLQLTPPVTDYVNCVQTPTSNCSLRHYASLVNDDVVKNVRRWRFRQDLPVNIAMVDYIDRSAPEIAESLIALNWRIAD